MRVAALASVACCLSMVVAGGLKSAAEGNPTIQTFVLAALFPVNLLLILLTGGVLITSTPATVTAAVFEGRLPLFADREDACAGLARQSSARRLALRRLCHGL
ncbi:unnamed protein product [Prorocentrum cordatum]|uniref:Uncharacterized protein n=1 Tax=Prorocentrum cordatum TaxID=2364126 RepID=A0ABN9VH19_9DINO|nr:unnamed protein product [Polarella glacialis]CAK0878589.1 unnamed protein product [Polarella glacialis]